MSRKKNIEGKLREIRNTIIKKSERQRGKLSALGYTGDKKQVYNGIQFLGYE